MKGTGLTINLMVKEDKVMLMAVLTKENLLMGKNMVIIVFINGPTIKCTLVHLEMDTWKDMAV